MLILAQMALIVRAQSGWGSLRGVHRKVPQPFLPLRGRLKTPSFQLQEPTGSQPKPLAACRNPCQRIWQPANPKAPARAAKLRPSGFLTDAISFLSHAISHCMRYLMRYHMRYRTQKYRIAILHTILHTVG